MSILYEAPQTDDGWVVKVAPTSAGPLTIEIEFCVTDAFRGRSEGLWQHVRFVTRSRLARLGINIRPTTEIDLKGQSPPYTASLSATVDAVVSDYEVEKHLSRLILPGLKVGRLVLCDPGRRLTGDQVYDAVINHEFQLPAPITIDSGGHVTIRPHRCIYELSKSIDFQNLLGVLTQEEGKNILNRLQLRRDVDHIVLKPGGAVITSCTMFLYKHFVMLDTRSDAHGQHLESVILDPVTTRGSNIFLEFINSSGKTILNPTVLAAVYAADEYRPPRRRWFGITGPKEENASGQSDGEDFDGLISLYRLDAAKSLSDSYFNRPVGIVADTNGAETPTKPQVSWTTTQRPRTNIQTAVARYTLPGSSSLEYYEIDALKKLEPGAGATVLLEYFPNHIEHLQICAAAVSRRLSRIVFRNASFEHGPFLSARDHGRLADYAAFGVEVLWCNEAMQEVACHVYRGRRGFFVPFSKIEDFRTRLVIAIYGSTLPLPQEQFSALDMLLRKLQRFFGGHVAFLTGGGPGAMQQAADVARSLDLLVGCNFLEIVDQPLQRSVDFYQTFQSSARHFRQRWFDIASFHIFCIGGLGTLEEIGLTLTDMKLGVIEKGPLVFFGSTGGDLYWEGLRDQLDTILGANRGPRWLQKHVLMTSDPDEVIDFYERVLEVGMKGAL